MRNDTRGRPNRPGAIVVIALVCLVIFTAVVASLGRTWVARRNLRKGDERRSQAEWLARAGLERAWLKLAQSPDFTGETWEIPAELLGSNDPGIVVISVEKIATKSNHRLVRVVAEYPREESRRSRHTLKREIVSGGVATGVKP
jgi:hypothetical protein